MLPTAEPSYPSNVSHTKFFAQVVNHVNFFNQAINDTSRELQQSLEDDTYDDTIHDKRVVFIQANSCVDGGGWSGFRSFFRSYRLFLYLPIRLGR
ncbi:hypothetical protein COL154_011312 [Colletotrichum chrysophilum]|nr:hypothetical protein KNSL1_011937 [Colletotrichum chrysophilum]KAJ0355724.1 hypothetical protein COL154_011312 [Colletotrichum chrysophilum]